VAGVQAVAESAPVSLTGAVATVLAVSAREADAASPPLSAASERVSTLAVRYFGGSTYPV